MVGVSVKTAEDRTLTSNGQLASRDSNTYLAQLGIEEEPDP